MKKILSLFVLAGCVVTASAQQDISLYTLNNVFQQLYVNPAYLPKSRVHIGLPVMSSVYINASNTGFAFGRFIGNKDETVDIGKVVDGLGKKNVFSMDVNTDLFSAGVRVKNMYFSFSMSERVNTNYTYPKDFFTLIFKGNASEELLGNRADMDGMAYNLNMYHEFALGASLPVGERMRVGVRAKYLMGLLNITTTRSKLGLTTDENTFAVSLDGDLALKTSGLGILKSEGDDVAKLLQNRILKPGGNTGLALDLAAEYYLNDRISLSGSLLNLGYIHWKSDVKNYENRNINYSFEGVDVQKLDSDQFSRELADKLDTLKERLKFSENSEAYSARLNPQLILGGNLALNDYHSIGTLVRTELISKVLRPSFTFYYQVKVNHWLGATVNYSYLNKSLVNLGGGFVVKAGPVQLYATSDNILAPLALKTTKTVQARFGINLAFGGREAKRLRVPEFSEED
ncbi:MAG: DUF5723 family protein [Bacteroidota bacterium]